MCKKSWVFGVLCGFCMTGVAFSASNGSPTATTTKDQNPLRRFYFLDPQIIPHAAQALNNIGMLVSPALYKPVQPAIYKPIQQPIYQPISPLQFADYEGYEDVELEEEHEEHKPNVQVLALLRPKKQKGKMQKKKKKPSKQPFKQAKKYFKKCLPFKVKIFKKSDLNANHNTRPTMPYGYGNEYFPQASKNQNMALISFNTSSLSLNGTHFPEILQFVYPGMSYPKAKGSKRRYRHSRPVPKKLHKRRPWLRMNPWRLAPAGKIVSKFPLREPSPTGDGGSPPPSPLFNPYKDSRIPVNQAYIETQTESSHHVVRPSLVNLPTTTPIAAAAQYHQEYHWSNPETQETKYSDPDYYRYGTYNQHQPQKEAQQEFFIKENFADFGLNQQPAQPAVFNPVTENYATTSEKIITVTPTTSWVPIPQLQRLPQPMKENNSQPDLKVTQQAPQYMRGGFKNLSSEATSTNFGDKLNTSCEMGNSVETQATNGHKCLEHKTGNSTKTHQKRIKNYRGNYKYHSKQKRREETTTAKNPPPRHFKGSKLTTTAHPSKYYYIEEVLGTNLGEGKLTHDGSFGQKTSGRRYDVNVARNILKEVEIVTAEYPHDNFSKIYGFSNNASLVRDRRSGFGGFAAVVSSRMQVKS